MTDMRNESRVTVDAKVTVIDLDSGKHIGNLLNISAGGLMLLSTNPIDPDRLYQLEIQFNVAINGFSTIQLGADSLWSKPSEDNTQFWTGFQIIDISEDNQQAITQLINED